MSAEERWLTVGDRKGHGSGGGMRPGAGVLLFVDRPSVLAA
jgi:hypothetical protein